MLPFDPGVGSVWLHDSRSGVVFQVFGKNTIAYPADEASVFHRKQYLDTPVEVARHQVRAARKYELIAAVLEVINAAVFQESPDNAAHSNRFAQPGDTRSQRTYAPNDQVDFNTRLRSFIEQPDHPGVLERIHLEDKPPISVFQVPSNLTADQTLEAGPNAMGSDEQFPVRFLCRVAGQKIE